MNRLILSSEKVGIPLISYPALETMGKTVLDVVNDGQLQYECIRTNLKMYPQTAGMFTIMDLTAEAEAFGCSVEFYKMDAPTVTSNVVSDRESVDRLTIPKVGDGRLPVFLKAAELFAQNIPDVPIFGVLNGPYTLASRLYDMTEMMMATIMEPDTVHALIDKCTVFLTRYAHAFKKAGAQGILIAEPAAGLLSPDHCNEFSSEYIKTMADDLQDDYFTVILHNCGNAEKLTESMVSTGCRCLHYGNAVDLSNIAPQIPRDIIFSGNIDPAGVLKNGTPEEVQQAVMDLLNKMQSYPNFLLSTGCEVPPNTPRENIHAFYDALNQHNRGIR